MTTATIKKPAPATQAKAQVASGNGGGLELVMLRATFYRDGFRALSITQVLSVIAIILALGLAIFLIAREPPRQYILTDASGRVVQEVPLSEAFVADTKVITWTAEAAVKAYSLDGRNFKQQVQDMAGYFTPAGHQAFKDSLEQSGLLRQLSDNVMIATAKPLAAPIIKQQFIQNGAYSWEVSVPVRLSLAGNTLPQTDVNLDVTMIVTRRSLLETPIGIGVSQLIAKQAAAR